MVNMVFNIRVPIVSGMIFSLVVIPRILQFFGLNHGILDVIVSPWFTFLVLTIAFGLLLINWLKSKKLFLLFYIIVFLVAFFGTLYFCNIGFPF